MGFSLSPDVATAVDKANADIGLELKKRYDNNASNLLRRSDQWPFLQRGVPALGFMTGLHPDYHTQYDRPEKINYTKIEKVARLIHEASWDLANSETRPKATVRSITQ
jgi:Zn-dependent M28 family amino/carboxypeptidase